MKDGIAGGMSNFQNSLVCYLYFFFPQPMFNLINHCFGRRQRSPAALGTAQWGKGLAVPWQSSELDPSTPSLGTGLGAAGRGLSTPCSTSSPRWCSRSCWSGSGAGALRGSGRTCGTAGASAGHGICPPLCGVRVALGLRGWQRGPGGGRGTPVPGESVWDCDRAGAAHHLAELCGRRRLAGC